MSSTVKACLFTAVVDKFKVKLKVMPRSDQANDMPVEKTLVDIKKLAIAFLLSSFLVKLI